MKKDVSPTLTRRRVFAGAGTVGALAAAAAVLPRVLPDATASDAATPAADSDGRYQLTQHVKRYYQTAKV